MNIDNLDCIDITELGGVREDFKAKAAAYKSLAQYAESRIEADYLRKNGDVEMALRVENRMQEIFNDLPDWARW